MRGTSRLVAIVASCLGVAAGTDTNIIHCSSGRSVPVEEWDRCLKTEDGGHAMLVSKDDPDEADWLVYGDEDSACEGSHTTHPVDGRCHGDTESDFSLTTSVAGYATLLSCDSNSSLLFPWDHCNRYSGYYFKLVLVRGTLADRTAVAYLYFYGSDATCSKQLQANQYTCSCNSGNSQRLMCEDLTPIPATPASDVDVTFCPTGETLHFGDGDRCAVHTEGVRQSFMLNDLRGSVEDGTAVGSLVGFSDGNCISEADVEEISCSCTPSATARIVCVNSDETLVPLTPAPVPEPLGVHIVNCNIVQKKTFFVEEWDTCTAQGGFLYKLINEGGSLIDGTARGVFNYYHTANCSDTPYESIPLTCYCRGNLARFVCGVPTTAPTQAPATLVPPGAETSAPSIPSIGMENCGTNSTPYYAKDWDTCGMETYPYKIEKVSGSLVDGTAHGVLSVFEVSDTNCDGTTIASFNLSCVCPENKNTFLRFICGATSAPDTLVPTQAPATLVPSGTRTPTQAPATPVPSGTITPTQAPATPVPPGTRTPTQAPATPVPSGTITPTQAPATPVPSGTRTPTQAPATLPPTPPAASIGMENCVNNSTLYFEDWDTCGMETYPYKVEKVSGSLLDGTAHGVLSVFEVSDTNCDGTTIASFDLSCVCPDKINNTTSLRFICGATSAPDTLVPTQAPATPVPSNTITPTQAPATPVPPPPAASIGMENCGTNGISYAKDWDTCGMGAYPYKVEKVNGSLLDGTAHGVLSVFEVSDTNCDGTIIASFNLSCVCPENKNTTLRFVCWDTAAPDTLVPTLAPTGLPTLVPPGTETSAPEPPVRTPAPIGAGIAVENCGTNATFYAEDWDTCGIDTYPYRVVRVNGSLLDGTAHGVLSVFKVGDTNCSGIPVRLVDISCNCRDNKNNTMRFICGATAAPTLVPSPQRTPAPWTAAPSPSSFIIFKCTGNELYRVQDWDTCNEMGDHTYKVVNANSSFIDSGIRGVLYFFRTAGCKGAPYEIVFVGCHCSDNVTAEFICAAPAPVPSASGSSDNSEGSITESSSGGGSTEGDNNNLLFILLAAAGGLTVGSLAVGLACWTKRRREDRQAVDGMMVCLKKEEKKREGKRIQEYICEQGDEVEMAH